MQREATGAGRGTKQARELSCLGEPQGIRVSGAQKGRLFGRRFQWHEVHAVYTERQDGELQLVRLEAVQRHALNHDMNCGRAL